MGHRVPLVVLLGVLIGLVQPASSAVACEPRTELHLGSPPAAALGEEPVPEPECRFVYPLEYPVLGGGFMGSPFGDTRDHGTRWHLGLDIFAPRLTPVVAAAAGTVTAIEVEPDDCCWMMITHDDRWSTLYVHLNNDIRESDDGLGTGVRPGLAVGDRVERGAVIGWIGDSGNAEDGVPHLHFELRTPDGTSVDPGPSLIDAIRQPATVFTDQDDTRPSFLGPFADDDGQAAEPVFELALSLGIQVWCDPWGVMTCAAEPATRTTAVSWMSAVGIGSSAAGIAKVFGTPRGIQPSRHALDELRGCLSPTVCQQQLTSGELTSLLRHASLTPGAGCEIASGSARDPVTRGTLLRILLRATGHLPGPPCGLVS